MSTQDANTANSEDRSMVSYAKRAGTYGLVALALSGCIIVRVPPPARNDPYQPPSASPIPLAKGGVHKMRFDCGAQATFRSQMAAMENFAVSFEAENLLPAKQLPSAALRLTWKGPGETMDVPLNVGSQNTRKAMGNFTVNAPAGAHDFVVMMPNGPDCGPAKVLVTFK
jgi:hypothetical protein